MENGRAVLVYKKTRYNERNELCIIFMWPIEVTVMMVGIVDAVGMKLEQSRAEKRRAVRGGAGAGAGHTDTVWAAPCSVLCALYVSSPRSVQVCLAWPDLMRSHWNAAVPETKNGNVTDS